jgi:hypothetical protein
VLDGQTLSWYGPLVIEQLGQVFAALLVSAFVIFLVQGLLEKLWAEMDGPDTYIRPKKRKPIRREYRDLTQTPELRQAVMRALLDKPDPVARFLADERPAWEAVVDLEAALDAEMKWEDGMDTERTWR